LEKGDPSDPGAAPAVVATTVLGSYLGGEPFDGEGAGVEDGPGPYGPERATRTATTRMKA
jgi:hypothetical protein